MTMQSFKIEITKQLIVASHLIIKCVNYEISLEDFIKNYNNFYYYEALDGHEAYGNKINILNELSEIISFHKLVQENVVNNLNLKDIEGNNPSGSYIYKDEALIKLRELCKQFNIEKLLIQLERK